MDDGTTQQPKETSSYRLALDLYLAFIFLVLLRFGIRFARENDNWKIAEWLINYHAGFVRRGLTGEIILAIAHTLHVPPPWLVLLAQMLCYLVLLAVFRKLILDSSKAWWVIALVLSPATLSFPLMNIRGGFRKDILFFASLAILIFLLVYRKISDVWISAYLCIALPACILSSESVAFYLPYYFAALLISLQSWRRSIRIFLLPAILACAATFVAMKYIGNLAIAQGVCNAAGYKWDPANIHSPCSGSILYLTYTPQIAHSGVLAVLATTPMYRLYPLLAVLAFLPILIGMAHLRRFQPLRSSLYVLAATVFVSACLTSVLFYYATDWGRWIYLHTMATALLLLVIERRKQSNPNMAEPLPATNRGKSVLAWILIAAYALCWDLPHMPGIHSVPIGLIRLIRGGG